ncbi:gtpase-activating protein gyp2 [Ophiostoma piceae UAMH 11346]|uniref:Gtpase-activating protein gyp2 n=1 Tax=Ophiostoma piceae (strain UAMH 11346) TaxID=1262450 RepID=S3BTN2_OPHP1|nr:gtpase-activating protein gyp2 [Ophiostoma piceae UAMH 11346]
MLSGFVQRAQQLLDPGAAANTGTGSGSSGAPAGFLAGLTSDSTKKNPSKASLFQAQFRLPASQHPLHEITAELTLPPSDKDVVGLVAAPSSNNAAFRYAGRLHLSESYLCFSTAPSSFISSASQATASAFTGQTHGEGPSGKGFIFPLCAIRRVERLHTQTTQFCLSLTSWNGMLYEGATPPKAGDDSKTHPREQRIIVELAGSRQACERFCDGLKKNLRTAVGHIAKMRKVAGECYSEYLLRPEERKTSMSLPDAGLGIIFRYPGDAKKLRDRAKMRLWAEYLRDNGRNLTMVRQPTFYKLIRVGLPNRLRGEMWELTSGSVYLRFEEPNLYAETLEKYKGQESLAIDEIEKDLNRSLPEYAGFQSEEGIGRLRRVLTAYSWVNADVGYCQAMNIVVAALLIYMSETQAFYLLSTLCDRLVPGYYSTTMYGTLLDQKVFESLVEKTMPIIWDHLVGSDVQLSVVSLPWFLSLYINSMPLVFAFRVLDVFFVEGPKVLFQVGLAILRINGEELLDAGDDGAFISVLKAYFSRLDESAHPRSDNPKLRAVTRFQELMVVAFKEFSGITNATVADMRQRNKESVLNNIENFTKRTAIRNLGPESKALSTQELGGLYDRFYGVLYERQQRQLIIKQQQDQIIQQQQQLLRRQQKQQRGHLPSEGAVFASTRPVSLTPTTSNITNTSDDQGRVGLGSSSQMDYDGFREFLAGMAKWAIADSPPTPVRDSFSDRDKNASFSAASAAAYFTSLRGVQGNTNAVMLPPWGAGPEPADHEFLQRLFSQWDKDHVGTLTLQDVVSGIARIKGKRDIMGAINYFFELHDDDGDGRVDREGILRMSETLLFLSRRGLEGTLSPENQAALEAANGENGAVGSSSPLPPGMTVNERFLGSVSAFIRRCFEYADPDHPQNEEKKEAKVKKAKKEDAPKAANEEEDDLAPPNAFAIDDDEEEESDDDDDDDSEEEESEEEDEDEGEDLMAMSPPGSPKQGAEQPTAKPKIDSKRRVSKAQSERANVALDPSNPMHITLPTFRMVVLADELLEQFFESSFPTSFHVIEGVSVASPSANNASALTTFANLGIGAGRAAAAAFSNTSNGGLAVPGGVSPGPRPPVGAGLQPGQAFSGASRGLRGVLDNIVTDGMRVAAEVRKRMEEAQRELEKNAVPGHANDDDDDDDDLGIPGIGGSRGNGRGASGSVSSGGPGNGGQSAAIDPERRSVRSSDLDLLSGADAEADGGAEAANVSPSKKAAPVAGSNGGTVKTESMFDA